jgi:putative spermidine/putrescine transport system ATP-binding protein
MRPRERPYPDLSRRLALLPLRRLFWRERLRGVAAPERLTVPAMRNERGDARSSHATRLTGVTSHALDLDGIVHRYGATTAVEDITIAIKPAEVLALLGPSGCGKTTLLKIIAGFVKAARGRVLMDGASIDHLPPGRRRAGIVFQNYALFPHLSVARNVAYGLEAQGADANEVTRRVGEMLDLVRLETMADRLPRELSGGQQQRVALARALAIRPRILLLDEPFGALDKNLRLDMQLEVKNLQRDLGITSVLVTHDQDEAMSMADRIAVLRAGRLEQVASPAAIYDRPASLFVSQFIGETNVLHGEIVAADRTHASIRLDAGITLTAPAVRAFTPGERAILSVRPEQLCLSDRAGPERFAVELRMTMPLGPNLVHEAAFARGTSVKVTEPRTGGAAREPGRYFCGLVPGAHGSLFPAESSRTSGGYPHV